MHRYSIIIVIDDVGVFPAGRQCAAAAVFTPEGQRQCRENLNYYHENAMMIANMLDELDIYYTGGKNSPYIWMKCPFNMSGWEFFDYLLSKAAVVGTPGEGFGTCGNGYFRLTSFNSHEKTAEATERMAYGSDDES